ncbi:MAG TPA: YihY/virulence factor BrkB family protein [Micromonosporaceae bacterium]|nr:YihY/virulence factor BrkB family protein [Micromonosporaceae bacterium]
MSSNRPVPETCVMERGELSADDAWHTLRRYGGWPLLRDSFLRFRYGDSFSHARAVGLQLSLAVFPALIALTGLASDLGLTRGGRVVADTVWALTPGASKSLVDDLLMDDHRTETIGETALTFGLVTAVVALTSAVGQIERGANRIYGVERDRPALRKYARALVLAVVAGLPALVGFVMLVAGVPLGESVERWYGWSPAADTAWAVSRWPVSLGLTILTVATLFRYAPRRHQPGMSWLMFGAGLATGLWWLASLSLAAFIQASGSFGATYGALTAVMALLLWANLTGIALFLGIAFAAQLEARRVGVWEPTLPDRWRSAEEELVPNPDARDASSHSPGAEVV